MSSALATAKTGAVARDQQDDETFIREHFAPGLTERDWNMLQAEARHRNLDIVKGEIKAIKFDGKMTAFPTLAGVRRIASETGKLDGSEGPFWCGDDGRWVEVWNATNPPVAAKFILYVKGRSRPVVAVANWNEAKGTHWNEKTRQTELNSIWKKMPALMLGKVAEVHALRRSGLIGDETVWTEDDDDAAMPTIEVADGQWNTANRRLHKAVADHQLGGHPEARALTAAVNPEVTSLRDAAPADMHEAAGIAEELPRYARDLIDGKAKLTDPPVAVVADPIDNERAIWRGEIESAYPQFRSAANGFMDRAKAEPWRFADLIALSPAKVYHDRYTNAARVRGVVEPVIAAAARQYQDREQIALERLKSTPLAELKVGTWDELWRVLQLRGLDHAAFVDVLGRDTGTFASAQDALEAYTAILATIDGAPSSEFDDLTADAETGEIVETTLATPTLFDTGNPDRFTR